mmetsp:Transcript_28650/g.68353  ORF Transcript_28650/g.68353 Transcript_28650/m.68353 type:complete len:203 (+) Transcript_28650:7921-8529(+)
MQKRNNHVQSVVFFGESCSRASRSKQITEWLEVERARTQDCRTVVLALRQEVLEVADEFLCPCFARTYASVVSVSLHSGEDTTKRLLLLLQPLAHALKKTPCTVILFCGIARSSVSGRLFNRLSCVSKVLCALCRSHSFLCHAALTIVGKATTAAVLAEPPLRPEEADCAAGTIWLEHRRAVEKARAPKVFILSPVRVMLVY